MYILLFPLIRCTFVEVQSHTQSKPLKNTIFVISVICGAFMISVEIKNIM